jgi:16S rRNA (cytosine967-C5)-methyltransferase
LVCNPRPGSTWWDACAGEGGKTLHLSDLMRNQGLIWASDRAEWRLQRLRRRAARAGMFNYRAVLWDGGPKLPTRTRFDGVLVDAPCSGMGTWGRNPHARWTTRPEDIRELSELQQRLLTHASAAVKPGGLLVYAVCSLAAAETTGVANTFQASHPDFITEPLTNPCHPATRAEAELWLWPQDLGGNGFFLRAWRRNAPTPA